MTVPETFAAAAGLFAVTNIDGLVVLTALFLASARGGPKTWQIVLGQYVGFVLMVLLSLLAAEGLVIIPREWAGLIGAFPLAVGIVSLVRNRVLGGREPPRGTRSMTTATLMIISNGVDNIAVYTPVFSALDRTRIVLTILMFLVLVALWCVLGRVLGGSKRIVAALARGGSWVVPMIFMAIGGGILAKSGSLAALIRVL